MEFEVWTILDYNKPDLTERPSIESFDRRSGSLPERLLFNNRLVFLLICAALTVFLGIKALDVRVNADFNADDPDASTLHRQLPEPL